MQPVITVLVFGSVAVLAFVILDLFFSEERRVSRVLRAASEWEATQAQEAEPLLLPFRNRILAPMVRSIGVRATSLFPADTRERLQHRLQLAGNPYGVTPDAVTVFQLLGAIVTPVVLFAVLLWLGAGLSLITLIGVPASAIAGYLAPSLWVDEMEKRRQAKIRRSLPDMLDMLTISVEAGLGFDMALVKLVRTASGPLAEEFGRMLSEVQAGVSRRDALRHLGERTDVSELDSFITAMVQADVFGVSVSAILSAQALELRKKRRQMVEERAQKAPVKMVFPIIFCMLPATMLVVLGPAVIAIGRTFGLIK